jgi:hypothetical protein
MKTKKEHETALFLCSLLNLVGAAKTIPGHMQRTIRDCIKANLLTKKMHPTRAGRRLIREFINETDRLRRGIPFLERKRGTKEKQWAGSLSFSTGVGGDSRYTFCPGFAIKEFAIAGSADATAADALKHHNLFLRLQVLGLLPKRETSELFPLVYQKTSYDHVGIVWLCSDDLEAFPVSECFFDICKAADKNPRFLVPKRKFEGGHQFKRGEVLTVFSQMGFKLFAVMGPLVPHHNVGSPVLSNEAAEKPKKIIAWFEE